jgi:hypothetical protein
VSLTAFKGLFREESGVNATVDDPGAALASDAADFVAAKGVPSVHADADDIAGLDGFGSDLLERLVDENGVASDGGCCRSEDEQPTWGNDCSPKRVVAGIYEMNTQESILPSCEE